MGCGARPEGPGAICRRAVPRWATAQTLDNRWKAGFKRLFGTREPRVLALRTKALEAAVEARELAAGVEQALLPAGPCGVRFGVDLEAQRVARLAVGRA